MTTPPSDLHRGSCLCGAIEFTIDRSQSAGEAHCHCIDCQRATGSAFASFCFIPDSGFNAIQGEPKGYTVAGSSGGDVTRFFCADCGSQLFSQVAVMPGIRFVKAGSLDDASWMNPQQAFWCDSAQPWSAIPSSVKKHASNPS